MKKIEVTVGIPTYNDTKNTKELVMQVLNQRNENFTLKNIIISIDPSTNDDIYRELKKTFKMTNKIIIKVNKARIGKPQQVNRICSYASSDLLVLFDSDVKLLNQKVLANLVEGFKNKNVGMVCGDRIHNKARTFWERCVHTSVDAYDLIKRDFNSGVNPYTCHGCVLAMSKKLYRKVNIPIDVKSDDTYLYFFNKSLGLNYVFAEKAKVRFKTPSTFRDILNQYKRFLNYDSGITNNFRKEELELEYKLPIGTKLKGILSQIRLHPIHSLSMFLINKYCQISYKLTKPDLTKWQAAISTK